MPQGNNGSIELTYIYEHPVLVKGYILQCANDDPDSDPKDWKIICNDINSGTENEIHNVEGEQGRNRNTDKEYRIDESKGPVWTDRITIRVTSTQGGSAFCHFN